MRVTLTFTPEAIASSIAGRPSGVAGIFTSTFGRSTRSQRARAAAIVPAVSRASAGATSTETKPSPPSEVS